MTLRAARWAIAVVIVAIVVVGAVSFAWGRYRQFVVAAKQSRVLADLHSWSTVVEAYRELHGSLPEKSGRVGDVLVPLVGPELMPQPFSLDSWGEPIEYIVSTDGGHFQIVSRGWKGVPEFAPGWIDAGQANTSCYEDDLVLQDGSAVRSPAGPQRSCTLGWWAGFWKIPQAPRSARAELARRH